MGHQILLEKLNHYGIRSTCHDLLTSYLSNRKQFTSINGIRSQLNLIKWGVPQGSVLGPLLFILFINDLPKSSNLNGWLFADDTALATSAPTFSELQMQMNREVYKVQNWLLCNKLSVHYAQKTQFILFIPKAKAKEKPKEFNILMGGNIIEQTSTYKYLGVIIDENLNWVPQITKMCSKLSSVCGWHLE